MGAIADIYRDTKQAVNPRNGVSQALNAPPSLGRFIGTNAWAAMGGLAAAKIEPEIKGLIDLDKWRGQFTEDTILAGIGVACAYGLDYVAGHGTQLPVIGSLTPYRGAIKMFTAGWMGWYGTEVYGALKELWGAGADWVQNHTGANDGLDEMPTLDGNPAMMREFIATLGASPDTLKNLGKKLANAVAEAIPGASAADIEKGIAEGFGKLTQAVA